jgi:membrane protease YdiL (CAAX protease family)
MKSDFLRNLGPGTQLMMLILIAFFTLFLMQITAFLVIRPIWNVNIFENIEEIAKLNSNESINITKTIQVFYHIGMFLLPALVFRKLFGNPNKDFFIHRKQQEPSVWMTAIIFFIIAYPLVNLIHLVNLQIPVSENLVADDAASNETLMKLLGGEGTTLLLVNILVYAIIPAIGEEFLFRGVIMRQIALSTKNIHLAVWVSAAFFSFIHGEITVFIPRFLMGVVLGYMFVWSGNIWIGVFAHLFNNILAIVIINSILNGNLDPGYEMLGANPEDIAYLISSILMVAIGIFFLYKKRNNSYRMFLADYEREQNVKLMNDDDILE